jgi:hypothetical protein
MARRSFALSKVYSLLEAGPVVMLTTARGGRPNIIVVEVIKAWIDPTVKNPRTIHHLGRGNFMVAGEKIKLRSKMK